MIDFAIMPRQSGKTTELIKLFNNNFDVSKMFICLHYGIKREISRYIPQSCIQIYTQLIIKGDNLNQCNNLYFDDFELQKHFNYNDIIELDYNKNIFIRTEKNIFIPGYENFIKYMKLNYPESLI